MIPSLAEWFGSGGRLPVRLHAPGQAEYHIFYLVEGAGPWLTFLHGFPTCSWDWARISSSLGSKYRFLMFDFLGFGDSDKPTGHRYSLFEQADLTEALWRHFGVQQTNLIAHDYGATVACELLSRQAEGRLSVRIERVILMNAGLYVDLQRPVLVQRLLQKPLLGQLLDHLIGEEVFNQQFSSVFSAAHPVSASDLQQYWSAITRHNGLRNYHRLIYYLTERHQNKGRWEGTLESGKIPLRFIWGLEDPVSGRHISEVIRQRISGVDLVELNGVGHYPQLEVPELVAREILNFL